MAQPSPSHLGAEDYREGALLRLQDAQRLYDAGCWVGCIYLAGRAAESILRALLWLRSGNQDCGHDLRDLLKRVRLLVGFPGSDDSALSNAVNELAVVWRNDLRFTGDARLKRLLTASGRLRQIGRMKIRGDALKANAKSVLEAGERVVALGEPYVKVAGQARKAHS